MKKLKISGITLFVLILLIGCNSKEVMENSGTNDLEKNESMKGSTSIRGTIISIDTSRLSTDKNSPCSKSPCWAEVRIEKINSVGQGGPRLTPGDTVSVNFKFTLSETTEELIPNLDKRMPGLIVGDKFQANIRILSDLNSGKLYTVYYYNKVE